MLSASKVRNQILKSNLSIKRIDAIHPYVSGNKFYKLKYNLQRAQSLLKDTVLTFGGAFSNHIAATAYAGKLHGLKSIGVIRGEELRTSSGLNPTLKFAKDNGMQLFFVTREAYKQKDTKAFQNYLKEVFGDFFLIPEGGTNSLAVQGCKDILTMDDNKKFDYICCSVGTGGTLAGLINSSKRSQKVIGFSALKGDFLNEEISKFATQNNWELITDYHFGGYAKINPVLITFINEFKSKYHIPLDPVYTGKMMYGVFDLMTKGYFETNSNILTIHTGGLQGIVGMNEKLKQKNLPLIIE